ncbi:MAG: tautomerase family protein, partial [Rubrivivax sp.]
AQNATRHASMPIVTITVTKPKSREFKAMILTTVHDALCAAGVNPRDRFHRVLELDEQDFAFDESFPDVRTKRTQDFVLVEILLGVGRSVKVKRSILAQIVEGLSQQGFDTENLMVVFQDVAWENWSPAGGRVPHG